MKIWKQKISFLGIAGVVYLIGEYLRGQWFLNTKLDFLCHPYLENGRMYCHSLYQSTGFVFITLGEVLAIAGVILLFANEQGVRAWWRMSRWYVPVSAVATLLLSYTFYLPVTGLVSAEAWIRLFGLIYILVTLVLVIRGFFVARRAPVQVIR